MRELRRHNDKFRFSVCVDQGESFLTPEGVTLNGRAAEIGLANLPNLHIINDMNCDI
jgi:hypothetical protein